MERSARPQDISWFLDLNKKGQINLDPPYQRKSVWTKNDKEYFLDTIFNNYPCPAVFLHREIDEGGNVTYHVVDGKQRLTTILDFVNEAVSIPTNFGNSRLAGKKWSELDSEGKRAFWNYVITVETIPDIDPTIVNNVFERINRNARKLLPQELRHARFDGWFVKRAEAEADKQEWKDLGIVTTGRSKRMADVQFISEIMILTIRREIGGFDQDMIDRFYADYDDPAETAPTFNEEEFDSAFEGIKKAMLEMVATEPQVGRHSRMLANFYSLWGYLLLAKRQDKTVVELASPYVQFMDRVTKAMSGEHASFHMNESKMQIHIYASNARGASTDLTPRLNRHDALSASLNS